MKMKALTAGFLAAGVLLGGAAGIQAEASWNAGATARLFEVCSDWEHPRQAARDAKALLDAGANPNGRNPATGYTPLIAAAAAGNVEVMGLLLSRHAHVNEPGRRGETALIAAARTRNLDAVAFLLAHGANVHAASNDGETALSAALEMDNDVQCAALLLKHGASPNGRGWTGASSLAVAAGDGNLEALALLLHYGANPNAAERDGMTPLMTAALSGETDAVQMLLASGAAMEDGRGDPCAVLFSQDGWTLLIGQFPFLEAQRRPHAILSMNGPLPGPSFTPEAAWISSGGTPERLAGKPWQTEKAKGWIFADPAALLKRLAAAKGRFVLEFRDADGRRASAEFSLKEAEAAVAALAHAG